MAIKRDRENGSLTISQTSAIEKIARGIGISTEKPSVQTPMATEPLPKLDAPDENPEVANFGYLNAVGSLLHVAQCTRPDISYAVGALARHSTTVGPQHVKAYTKHTFLPASVMKPTGYGCQAQPLGSATFNAQSTPANHERQPPTIVYE